MAWPDSAMAVADSEKIMIIATCSDKGSWSTPVYYVFKEKLFYFFSNTESRHIIDAGIQIEKSGNNMIVGVSIFSDSPCFDDIKGLQMNGKIERISKQREAVIAARDYIKKFKINIGKKDGLQFIIQHFHASLYKFIPEIVYYMDNHIKFGLSKKIMP